MHEMIDRIGEVRIDNRDGWGSVPDNQNVAYKGLRVAVRPKQFLRMANELGTPYTASDIEKHIGSGGTIGAPFLMVAIPQDWFEGDLSSPAEIYGHEGRNRMTAILRSEGDEPVETHLFFGGGVRNRDLTPEIIDRLNGDIVSERGSIVRGPWFSMQVPTHVEGIEEGQDDLTAKIRGYFAAGTTDDILDAIEDVYLSMVGNIHNSREIRNLFDANMKKVANAVLQEIMMRPVKDIPVHVSALRDMINDTGIDARNAVILNALEMAKTSIANKISKAQLKHILPAVHELGEWGLRIDLRSFVDLEKQKDNILRLMLTDLSKGLADNVSMIVSLLRSSGVTWTELDSIDKSLSATKPKKLGEVAKVRISKDPNDLGAYVDDEGEPEPTVHLKLSDITSVLEPDEHHAEKPGASKRIARMVKSIKDGKKLPPILVRKHGDGYQVLDGHHRFKAYRIAKVSDVPARIVDPENITGDIDEAWSNRYKKSIDCSNPKGFSQRAHCAARRKRAAGGKTKSKPVRETDLQDNSSAVVEAPLGDYQPLGDFDRPGPFRGPDKKLVPHPTNQLKATRFFDNTPYNFRLFFSNIPGTGRYSEYGPMDPAMVREIFKGNADRILNGSENAITVVFVGNKGDSKVMLTPWIMAHRIGHAIQAGQRTSRNPSAWHNAEMHFFAGINRLLEQFYGKFSQSRMGVTPNSMRYDLTAEYNALFNAIGTQRSSRKGQIRRPYEFLYELFAQYLGTGRITLKPLPQNQEYGRKAWGRSSKALRLQPDPDDEARYTTETLARDMEIMFDDVLSELEGKVLVM